jgi:uncharacterized membrane protein YjgN (DUF898 family)
MLVPESSAPQSDGRGHFLGDKREYWRILARDALSLVLTLGIYRFWVSSDVRRYLWSHSEVAGEQLDYTGDPLDLLRGFLVLVVVLGPLLAISPILAIAAGDLRMATIAQYAPVMFLSLASVLALYQARRYRVDNTVFRGLRFHQTGSAWLYALRATGWLMVNLLTLGLSYPWARSSQERYKMGHTFYGDVRGGFEGSGWQLFKRGIGLWAIALGPAYWLKELFASVAWAACALVLVYPLLHAMVLRWRISGMRFGTLSFESDFPIWPLYKAYLKFYGSLLLLAIVGTISVNSIIVAGRAANLLSEVSQKSLQQIAEDLMVIGLVIFYFVGATAAAFAYQATVRFETWHSIVDALIVRGLDQFERAKANPAFAAGHPGRIGAALNLGGY